MSRIRGLHGIHGERADGVGQGAAGGGCGWGIHKGRALSDRGLAGATQTGEKLACGGVVSQGSNARESSALQKLSRRTIFGGPHAPRSAPAALKNESMAGADGWVELPDRVRLCAHFARALEDVRARERQKFLSAYLPYPTMPARRALSTCPTAAAPRLGSPCGSQSPRRRTLSRVPCVTPATAADGQCRSSQRCA